MNEIMIVIKARNETAGAFTALNAEAAKAGDDAGETITKKITEKIKVIKDDPVMRSAGVPIGDTLGETISKRVTEKVKVSIDESFTRDVNGRLRDSLGRFVSGGNKTEHEKIKLDVDVDEKSFGARLHSFFDRFKAKLGVDADNSFWGNVRSIADRAGGIFGDGLKTGFTSIFSGDLISTLLKTLAVGSVAGALAGLVAPLLGSALGLAFAGGGIALGVTSALKDPMIVQAISGLKARFKSAFDDFGINFKAPVFGFLERLPSVLKPLQPMVQEIGRQLGPIADQLGTGVIGFLQNVLPSIGRATERLSPIITVLADKLPGIGDALARLFDHISSGAPEAAQFFSTLLDVVKLLLRALGVLVNILYNVYGVTRQVARGFIKEFDKAFGFILAGAVGAFGWIPGLRGKLESAEKKFHEFSQKAIRELDAVPDRKDLNVFFHGIGTGLLAGANAVTDIGKVLAGGRASGGITGSANGATPSGLTWVGEHGPELISAPAGSRVYSNPDSMRMAAGAGGAGMFAVNLILDGVQLASALVDPQRKFVRQNFGGNVQLAYGRG